MKKIFTILIFTSLFAGELEVDGDLTVTGNIQSQTIDSLLQVISDLQSQLSGLQGGNRLETRIFETQWLNDNDIFSIYTDLNIPISNLDFYLLEIVSAEGVVLGGGSTILYLQSTVNNSVRIDIIYQHNESGGYYYHDSGSYTKNIFTQEFLKLEVNEQTLTQKKLKLAITAQFPPDSDVQLRKTGLQSKDKKTEKQ